MRGGFDLYKDAIRDKYEREKFGEFSNYLLQPTDAKLRKLCELRLQDNPNQTDHAIFARSFSFPFEGNARKLVKHTEGFKTAKNFLLGKSVLTDENAADLLALIVDVRPRPLRVFLKTVSADKPGDTGLKHVQNNLNEGEKFTAGAAAGQEAQRTDKTPASANNEIPIGTATEVSPSPNRKVGQLKKYGFFAVATAAVGVAILLRDSPKCMRWKSDHYEVVDCKGSKPIVPYNENLLNFRKIDVTDTTSFFRDGKPVLWYLRQDNRYEFFNDSGAHPVNGRKLRPVTQHIAWKFAQDKGVPVERE